MNKKRDRGAAAAAEEIQVGDHTYVLAVSSRADNRTRVLKHGETFGIFDRYGDIVAKGLGDQGLFHEGMRYLSSMLLSIDGLRPLLLGSSVDEDSLVQLTDLTNPDMSIQGMIDMQRGTIHVLRTGVIWRGVLHQRFLLHNYGLASVHHRLGLRVDADFADMFEVRGVARARRGLLHPPRIEGDGLVIQYDGLDGVTRSVRIEGDPPPRVDDGMRMEWEVHLEAGQNHTIDLHIECRGDEVGARPRLDFPRAIEMARERVHRLAAAECEIESPYQPFNDWIERSRVDLRLMLTETSEGEYPYAGVPWFSTPFGRDGIVTALETLWMNPETTRGVLSYLAATQASATDPKLDSEPGKIVHEVRRGEMAATGEVPYGKYYGSVDATPLFVMLAGEYLRFTGDRPLIERLWRNIERAMSFIDACTQRDPDGFLTYERQSSDGLVNQGWKDSRDSVFCDNGDLAAPPIALCEVQGYVYAARRAASEVAAKLGHTEFASAQARRADELQQRFDECFWDEALGTFVVALDGRRKPCRVASSNAGHCLFTGIASPERAQRIVTAMMGPKFFSGWGIRTVAMDQPRFNPMSYHNGSMWPHDTALFAAGAARYGYRAAATQLLGAMLDVAKFAKLHRLPELLCGFTRQHGEGPIWYPIACAPQAWAAGAVFMMLQACLGLSVRADRGEVVCEGPVLPSFLPYLRVRGLRVGSKSVDLLFHQQDGDLGVSILRRDPGVRVVVAK